mgnify:CR=1 FL=1
MTDTVPVTVAVISHNGRKVVPLCLESIANQDVRAAQVLFADNASTDGAPDWVRDHHPEVEIVSMGVNYGCEKVRFPAPVPVGSRIRGAGEIISAEEVKGGVQVVVRITIEIENSDRPACVIDTISRFFP